MQSNVNEKDWKLFRSRLAVWQESYMEKLVEEYKALLNGDEQASDKFWALWKRMQQDKRSPGVLVENIRRSTMRMNLLLLLRDDIITIHDLDGFSEELQEDLKRVVGGLGWGHGEN